MKYSVIIFCILLIMFLCECSASNDTNKANEHEHLFDNLVQATVELWKDVKKVSLIEDESENKNFTETGRGRKTSKMAIPLMFGFKMAGVVISALTALKLLLIQSLFMSKFALAAALVLGFKTLFEHMHGHLYKTTDISHVNGYGYSSLPAHVGLESAHYESVLDPATIGYAYYTPTEDTTGEELQNQFSNGVLHAAQDKNSTALDRFYSTGVRRPNKKIMAVKTIIRKRTDVE